MEDKMLVTVMYRGKKFTAEVLGDATVGLLGKLLSQLTGVTLPTMRLLVPKGKRMPAAAVLPASESHSSSTIHECGIIPGIVMKMMGVSSEELKEVTQPVKEQRVLGFAEEEQRGMRRRQQQATPARPPKGPYTFQDFRTLELPFVELNPPPKKARALMYKLASDPGIVGIMNKHKWQVGIMTELAPKGHVGISPKCTLGYNLNRGQEISLRLRTDDLQGFRKYASIKKTLLHELAHMVHDEHDEKFHALDKQLNQEAIDLDWTSSTGHTLSGAARVVEDDDELMDAGGVENGHKLGGGLPPIANARIAAVQAAIMRLERNKLASDSSKADEPDPDEKAAEEILVIAEGTERDGLGPTDDQHGRTEPDPDEALEHSAEPDPDESTSRASVHASITREREPDPDDSQSALGVLQDSSISRGFQEPDPDDMLSLKTIIQRKYAEPDPDESTSVGEESDPDESMSVREEPDPDDKSVHSEEPDPDEKSVHSEEPDPDDKSAHSEEPDPDDKSAHSEEPDPDESMDILEEPDPDENGLGMVNDEIVRIQAATAAAVARLQHAVTTLRQQATLAERMIAIKALSTIVSNLIYNPNVDKYKLISKGNPRFQDRVARFKGAVEFLQVVGFSDGTDCFVLRRSDPGLLWLAHSVLEPLLA